MNVNALIPLQKDKERKYPTIQILTLIINWAQVVINPTIYVAYHKRYRFAIKHLLRNVFKVGKQDGALKDVSYTSAPRTTSWRR